MSAKRMEGVVGIDVETGGLDCRRHALLSIGLYAPLPDGDRLTWSVLVERDPEKTVDPDAGRVNGWKSDAQWKAKGAVPLMAGLAGLVIKVQWLQRMWFGRKTLRMVAHGAGFDRAFLEAAMTGAGFSVEVLWWRWECSMAALAFCRRAGLLEDAEGSCSLDALTELRTGKPDKKRMHGAALDAMLCWRGYEWLLDKCGKREPEPEELVLTENSTPEKVIA